MTTKQISDSIRRINPMYVAVTLSLIMLAVIISVRGAVHNGDTPSYIGAWDVNYANGILDDFRTPVYPVIIGMGKMLCGSHWEVFVIALQGIVFYICGIYFSRMAMGIISNRKVAWFTVFLYFLFFPIVNFIPVIGTEVIGFSLAVLWGYCIWRFLQQARWGYGIAISLLTLAEIMLRPSFLVLAIAIACMAAAGIFIRQYRRSVLLLLVTLIPTAAVYTVYTAEMARLTGVNTISTVSIFNKYFMARQYNDILPDLLVDNPAALELQLKYQKDGDVYEEDYINRQWAEIMELVHSGIMNYRMLEEYADGMKERHAGLWYKNILRNISMSLHHQGALKNICNDLVVLLFAVAFLISWIRYRKFPLVNFMSLLVAGGTLLSIFLYAQNDYGRLMLPVSSFLILMGGQMLNCLHWRPLSIRLSGILPK